MAEQPGIRFTIEGRTYDITDLTWGEVEEIEEQFDLAFSDLEFGRAKVMRAIVVRLMRHDSPDLKPEDLDGIRILKDFEVVEDTNGQVVETVADRA
jgi:hypothetical protein